MEQAAQYIVPAIAGMTAIILLVAGGKLLKPAIGLSGGLIGVGSGLLMAPSMSSSIPPFVFALIFCIIAAVIAVYIAKFAILITLGISFAIITPVLTWHIAGLGDSSKTVQDIVEAATSLDSVSEETTTNSHTSLSVTQDAMASAFAILTNDAASAIRSGSRRASAAWNQIPTGPRLMLVGSAVVGLLMGLLISTFMPFFASVLVTSAAGGILLVETVRNFITLIWSQQTMADISQTVLIATTASLILAGIGFQLTLSRKSLKPKSHAE